MTTAQMIDAEAQDWLELSLADPYVQVEWRRRILMFLKVAVWRFWNAFAPDCDFKLGEATVAIVAGVGTLPVTFNATGPQGGVWPTSSMTGEPLEYIEPKQMWMLRHQTAPETAAPPRQYTISGGSLYTYPLITEDVTLHFRKRTPVLIDNNDTSGTVTDNGLGNIPAEYHDGPIFWAVADMLAVQGGDGRANTELSPRAKEMFNIAVAERTQGAEQMRQYGQEGIPELENW